MTPWCGLDEPCDLNGGAAQSARYFCPDDRADLWAVHVRECPTQRRTIKEAKE